MGGKIIFTNLETNDGSTDSGSATLHFGIEKIVPISLKYSKKSEKVG